MPVLEGRLAPVGRVGIVVSRYNELITGRLLDGALDCCRAAGLGEAAVDVLWVPGAFELAAAASVLAASGKYRALVALGAVIRGDTPHFDYVAGEAAHGINAVALQYRLPVAFGVLTVDTFQQAADRAGGSAGNKGYEAAEAAIRTADVLQQWSASA
jgi:6,7-dimethyl-8-ribityllumazine synthase